MTVPIEKIVTKEVVVQIEKVRNAWALVDGGAAEPNKIDCFVGIHSCDGRTTWMVCFRWL